MAVAPSSRIVAQQRQPTIETFSSGVKWDKNPRTCSTPPVRVNLPVHACFPGPARYSPSGAAAMPCRRELTCTRDWNLHGCGVHGGFHLRSAVSGERWIHHGFRYRRLLIEAL